MADKTVKVAESPDLMTGEETADHLGLNPKTLQRWAREGRGPHRVRIGNRVYYFRPEVQAWLTGQFTGKGA
jgi:predicted DNA-binding transcriptional regulator AlpA